MSRVTVDGVFKEYDQTPILERINLPNLNDEARERLRDRRLRPHAMALERLEKMAEETAGVVFKANDESDLDDEIGVALLEDRNPTVGLAAHSGQVDVRIAAKADTTEQADTLIAAAEVAIRQRVGQYVFGIDTDTIEQALINVLREQNAVLFIV